MSLSESDKKFIFQAVVRIREMGCAIMVITEDDAQAVIDDKAENDGESSNFSASDLLVGVRNDIEHGCTSRAYDILYGEFDYKRIAN